MDDIQKKIIATIDKNADKIIEYAEDIFKNAELGFKETRTAGKTSSIWKELGLSVEENLGITGVRATLNEEKDFTIAAIGELDAVICPNHPYADEATGAAHVCGHNAQLAAILGASIALSDPEVKSLLDGKVQFIAIPAEEYLEIEYRQDLMKKGKTKAGGGKGEFLLRGYFDNTDIAICHHMHSETDHKEDLLLGNTSANGFITKRIHIKGKASHAGAAPEKGINALNAAALGLNAVAFARETFDDRDFVRVHPVISHSSNSVNVVPDDVQMESFVRAKSLEAIMDASKKVDRAFKGAAYAIGAEVEIVNGVGYLPVFYREPVSAMIEAAELVCEKDAITYSDPLQQDTYSSDIGDLMNVVPTLYFSSGGFAGYAHSADLRVTDPVKAYVLPAKVMALTIYNLLKNKAEQGKKLLDNPKFKPTMTIKEYSDYIKDFI